MKACGELVPYIFLGCRDKARALAVISSGIRFPDALINGPWFVDHDPALITVNNISCYNFVLLVSGFDCALNAHARFV